MFNKFAAAVIIGALASSVQAVPDPANCSATPGFRSPGPGLACVCVATGSTFVTGTDTCRCFDSRLTWASNGLACGFTQAQQTAELNRIRSQYNPYLSRLNTHYGTNYGWGYYPYGGYTGYA